MDLKALRAFVKVAELGSISQAAMALGLTQSSLSRIVAGLEKSFGSPLFYRTGRGVTLTDVGDAALPRARRIVIESEQLFAEVRDFGQEPSGVVTLGLMPSLMTSIAGPLYREVREHHPRITLRMLEGFSARVEEWLADGTADIGFVSRYRKADFRKGELLATSHLVLVGVPGESREPRSIRFRELARIPLVLPAIPNGLRIAVDAVAHRLGVKLNVVAEADSLEAQKAIISLRGCRTVLSLHTVQREVASGALAARAIVEPQMPRAIIISTTTQRPLSRAARQVIAVVRRLNLGSDP